MTEKQRGSNGYWVASLAVLVAISLPAFYYTQGRIRRGRLARAPLPKLTRPLIKGVSLLTIPNHFGFSYPALLSEIRALGATHVSLVPIWRQQTVLSESVYRDARTMGDAALARLVVEAQRRGLKVVLNPIVRLKVKRDGEWRGKIRPADWGRWFTSYGRMVRHYADFSKKHGVAMLVVGSELSSSEGQTALWLALITSVRQRFAGKLIYAANWDHFRPIAFWHALDYVGMSAYFGLTNNATNPSLVDLIAGWERQRGVLVRWLKSVKRPLIFTELGYRSVPYAGARPWDEHGPATPSPEIQRRCYAAFVKVWNDELALGGVFWWNWVDGRGGLADVHYTPRHKPAQTVIAHWFGAKGARK